MVYNFSMYKTVSVETLKQHSIYDISYIAPALCQYEEYENMKQDFTGFMGLNY